MKKILLVGLVVALFGLFSCSPAKEDLTIKVGATPVPHAELLNLVIDDLKDQGITLEVVEFTDYVTPNLALSDGEIDANFFQHQPYLDEFAGERNLDLSSIGSVHVEPLGLYSKKFTSAADLPEGAEIAIPSDSVNGGRALLLLASHGLIELKEDAGLKATEDDITVNSKNFKFVPVEAAQLPRVLEDLDASIINGNYALEAELNPSKDALLLEGSQSPYTNIVVVRTGEENNEALQALIKALQSDEIKNHINNNYGGGVVEAFN